MRPSTWRAAVAMVALLGLAGCEDNSLRSQLGLLHQGPDQFAVLPNRPIEVPDHDDLPPPEPGAASPIAPDPLGEVKLALGSVAAAPLSEPSDGERTVMAMLGPLPVEDGIREMLAAEHEEMLDEDTPLVHKIFGIEQRRYRRANALDASEELDRLRGAGVVAGSRVESEE